MDTTFCAALSHTKEYMKECVSCCSIMFGVYSYEVRETCQECNGKAKQ